MKKKLKLIINLLFSDFYTVIIWDKKSVNHSRNILNFRGSFNLFVASKKEQKQAEKAVKQLINNTLNK